MFILCPYCLSPISEETTLCPTCGEDTTRDAAFEWSPEEYQSAPRQPCPFCGAAMLALAVVCPACQRWKRDYPAP